MNSPNDVFLNKSDFDGNTYTSKVLNGLRYRLLRDKDVLLEPNVDYSSSNISFTIISFNVENDTKIQIQFY